MDKMAIIVRNVTKKFGNVTVLDNVSLQVKKGTICGIVGRNLLDVEDMTEKVFFILFIAVLIACGFGIRIISARTNREEYEMQINADKDET